MPTDSFQSAACCIYAPDIKKSALCFMNSGCSDFSFQCRGRFSKLHIPCIAKSSAFGKQKIIMIRDHVADGNKRQSCNRFESVCAARRRERQRKKNDWARERSFFTRCLRGLSLWEQIRVCASFFLSGGATKKPITSVSIAPVNG